MVNLVGDYMLLIFLKIAMLTVFAEFFGLVSLRIKVRYFCKIKLNIILKQVSMS